MSQDYQEMWRSLGLNLEAHQGLLAVLSDAYQGIYLSQKDRPAAMQTGPRLRFGCRAARR